MKLKDEQWERLAPELPGKVGDPGGTAEDNRLFVEAVLWIARTGAPVGSDQPAPLSSSSVLGTTCAAP